jgi:hypothetical protein
MDMIGLALKSMGVDPSIVLKQAIEIGAAFQKLAAQLDAIQANQEAIMTHLGLSVPPPAGAVLDLIALESRRITDAYGGAVEAQADAAMRCGAVVALAPQFAVPGHSREAANGTAK